jgi:hypothetical protein
LNSEIRKKERASVTLENQKDDLLQKIDKQTANLHEEILIDKAKL